MLKIFLTGGKHQGPGMEPFQNEAEREKHYVEVLGMGTMDGVEDAGIEEEMDLALNEYSQIGSDLGIVPITCKSLAEDPTHLARWIIGEDKINRA